MSEIANATKLIALKVEYADGEKKSDPDTKGNDKFYEERNKMAEIANDTKLITLKFAYADGEKKSDPDTKRNDKIHDKRKTMAEITNYTEPIALKVAYTAVEKKSISDKRKDKRLQEERKKQGEIRCCDCANGTEPIAQKTAHTDTKQRERDIAKKSNSDPKRGKNIKKTKRSAEIEDQREGDCVPLCAIKVCSCCQLCKNLEKDSELQGPGTQVKGHDKVKKSAETRCCECETKQKENHIAKKSNSDPKRDRNKRTKRSAEVEDQREAESDQSCAIKICSCCKMCKNLDKDSGTQVKFRDERKKEGEIRCCDCANDPDTKQREKDITKKCCSDPKRDKNTRKTRRSTEIEDQREAESDQSCEKKICTCCQWCKDKEPESEEFQDKRKKNAEKHCCCDCASGTEQKTAHTDVRKKSDPDTKRKEKETAKKCYSDPKRDKNNKKTRGSAEIKDEREAESTPKTCSCCKLSKDKESSEKTQEVCRCREIGKKKQKNKKQDNAHSDEKMPCSKSEPLPAKNQAVPKPRRKKVKGKKTKGNSSISVIGTSFKDNCCACCALLAEYGHEVIKLFSLECHTKVTEIFCELCDVGCCLCNDCLNFLRKLICCIGDLFNKSGLRN